MSSTALESLTVRQASVEGMCTAADFLAEVPRGHELVDGRIETLPMPTREHDRLMRALIRLLEDCVGFDHVSTAGYRVKTVDGRYREPDVMYVADLTAWPEEAAERADLAIEIVSGSASDRHRDVVTKRTEYARAAFPEYWIVDPANQTITILSLRETTYTEHAVYAAGDTAQSLVVPNFRVDVSELFEAGRS